MRLWPASAAARFERPLRELLYALLGGAATIPLGMLWSRGIRIPEDGTLGPLGAALNQVLIFAPALLVPLIRRQSRDTAWCGGHRIALRVAAGLLLGALAVLAYSLLRRGAAPVGSILGRILAYQHLDEAVQVLCEDVLIAILAVRLAAKVGVRWAAVAVAGLFAAGHVPALLSAGATFGELGRLLLDFGLGAAGILTLARSRDILWFWPIHFMLDMTQFERVSFAP